MPTNCILSALNGNNGMQKSTQLHLIAIYQFDLRNYSCKANGALRMFFVCSLTTTSITDYGLPLNEIKRKKPSEIKIKY